VGGRGGACKAADHGRGVGRNRAYIHKLILYADHVTRLERVTFAGLHIYAGFVVIERFVKRATARRHGVFNPFHFRVRPILKTEFRFVFSAKQIE